MILRLLKIAAIDRLSGMRRRIHNLVLLFFAGFMATFALIFLLLGIFLLLSEYLSHWQAALLVAGGLLLISLALLIPELFRSQRRKIRAMEDLQNEAEAMVSSLLSGKGKPSHETTWKLVGTAALIGIILGHSIKK